MTQQTFDRCASLMAEMWPSTAPTPQALAVYWLVLQEMHDSVFEAAVMGCLKDCTFYPKPAEIRQRAKSLLSAAGVLPPQGEQAWARLLEAMKRWHGDIGWFDRVNPLDEPTKAAVAALAPGGSGLERIAMASLKDLGFIRQEFVGYYDHRRAEAIEYAPLAQALPAAPDAPRLMEAIG